MKREYTTADVDAGEPVLQALLDEYGAGGWALVATIPFQSFSHYSDDWRATGYFNKKLQLIFMRDEP